MKTLFPATFSSQFELVSSTAPAEQTTSAIERAFNAMAMTISAPPIARGQAHSKSENQGLSET